MTPVMRPTDDPDLQARLVSLLRETLEDHGRDQRATARALGVSQPLVSMALSGKRPVSAELAVALAGARGVSLDDLFELGPTEWQRAPGFAEAVTVARTLFPRVREGAWERLGRVRAAAPPHWDPAKLGILAALWDDRVASA